MKAIEIIEIKIITMKKIIDTKKKPSETGIHASKVEKFRE